MRTIDEYCDAAIARQKFSSDRELATAVGCKSPIVSHWRTKRTWPSDLTMIRLCELANVDPAEGLLDLGQWRANNPAVQAQYSRMADLIKRAGLAASITLGIFVGLLAPAQAAPLAPGLKTAPIYTLCDKYKYGYSQSPQLTYSLQNDVVLI